MRALKVPVKYAGSSGSMRVQRYVGYAVHGDVIDWPGCGYTDGARFVFHIGVTAFLFGKHLGKTLVVEFFTTGFFLRFRLVQTVA
jgi:hypothetical protein